MVGRRGLLDIIILASAFLDPLIMEVDDLDNLDDMRGKGLCFVEGVLFPKLRTPSHTPNDVFGIHNHHYLLISSPPTFPGVSHQ